MFGKIADNLPIRPRGTRRINQLANPLDTALGIHERTVFFKTGCGRQKNMPALLCRLGAEQVDDDQKVNLRKRFGRFALVRECCGNIVADHD